MNRANRVDPLWFTTMRRVLVAGLLVALCAACHRGASPPRHLLLITVDTLRADRLGCYGSPLALTPSIDSLALRSVVFTRAYAPAPFTLASLSALMTGRYPEEIGIDWNFSVVPDTVPTLASVLRSHGWWAGAVVSNYVLRQACGLSAGFDAYDVTLTELEAHRLIGERTAVGTTDAALRLLDARANHDAPAFLWVHFQDPHGPYTPPGELRSRYLEHERKAPDAGRQLALGADDRGLGAIPRYQFDEGHYDPAYYRAGYDGEVRHVDAQIGRLLDELTRRGFLERAAVVFAADHGEGLGEDDYWFAHGEYLTDFLVRVPLLVGAPGVPPQRRNDVTSLVDLLPTLARLLGVELPDRHPGRDLLAPGAEQRPSTAYLAGLREASVPRFGLVKDGYRYLVSLEEDGPREQLWRIGTDGPPSDDDAKELRRELASFRQSMLAAPAAREQTLSESDRQKLRALGYLGD